MEEHSALNTTRTDRTSVNERCRRKDERSKQGQTNNKAKQHSTPKAVTVVMLGPENAPI